uniref:Uncharacterized protein n=1 Tax=Molossus molossus TaxID=27622 RepID=A0A7J8DTB1_MOLMO|nr:hypothetical protein HJG59_009165 [Molossus molossus]
MEAENPREGGGETKAGAVKNGADPARQSQPVTVSGWKPAQTIPKPDDLRDHVDDGNLEFPQKREEENGGRFIHWLEVNFKGDPHDVNIIVSQENPEIVRQLWKRKQMKEELAAEITSLKTEKVSLQPENSNLKDEIQQLKLKLRILPERHEVHVTQLQKQLCEEEIHCLEMRKAFPNTWRYMNSTYQFLNMYRKMAQGMNQELEEALSTLRMRFCATREELRKPGRQPSSMRESSRT